MIPANIAAQGPVSQLRLMQRALAAHWLTALMAGAVLGIQLIPGLGSLAEFDRHRPFEVWRLGTCHFAHFDGKHLGYDLAMLVLLAAILERRDRRGLVWCLLAAGVAIPLAIAAWQPSLTIYRGASGIDSALFAMLITTTLHGAWRTGQRGAFAAGTLIAMGFLGKTGYEVVTGAAVFADSDLFEPVPLAHLVGALIGMVLGVARRRWASR